MPWLRSHVLREVVTPNVKVDIGMPEASIEARRSPCLTRRPTRVEVPDDVDPWAVSRGRQTEGRALVR